MTFDGYPAQLAIASDCASQAQKRLFQLTKLQIGLLLAVSIDSAVNWQTLPEWRTPATILVAMFLVLAITATAIVSVKKYDHTWFVCRSIAESTKGETWRYMMKIRPYEIDDQKCDESFVSQLKVILDKQDKPIPVEFLATQPSDGRLITRRMEQVRGGGLTESHKTNSKKRIEHQEHKYRT